MVAKRLGICTEAFWVEIERGLTFPSAPLARKICKLFSLSHAHVAEWYGEVKSAEMFLRIKQKAARP